MYDALESSVSAVIRVFGEDQRKVHLAGTDRTREAEETLELVRPLMDEAGITRVAVATGLDVIGIPVVMVTRPASFSLSVTQGKGVSLAAAKVSGILEAVEHYHAETIQGSLRYASEQELQNDGVLATDRVSGRADTYSNRDRLLWFSARSLVDARPVWVPFDLVHLDFRSDGPAGMAQFLVSSNGLASGNSRLEAACHASFEVVERHLTAGFYDLGGETQEQRRVVPSSIDDPTCSSLLEKLQRARVEATIWDLSDALEVPCFLCEVIDAEQDPFRGIPSARGMGCHSDRGVALARAICEAVQSRLTLISGARDDIVKFDERARRTAIANAHQRRRARASRFPQRTYAQAPSHRFDTLANELSWLVGRINRAGFNEVIGADLSKPGWPVSVVRVLIPGMRFSKGSSPLPATEGQAHG